jgi:hypothetical protein
VSINQFIDSVLGLTWVEMLLDHKNTFDKAHEIIIQDLLVDAGFTLVNSIDELINNTFIREPNGSQQSPDFLIRFDNITLEVDLKSSSSGVIMWNSHLPKPNSLYIYSKIVGNVIQDTTVFIGKDINFDLEALNAALHAMDIIVDKYNKLYPDSDIHLFNRKMYVDKLGNLTGKKNIKRRKYMESNVKKFISEGINNV